MNPNITSLGGVCSVLLGVLSAVAGLVYFLLPEQQRLGGWLRWASNLAVVGFAVSGVGSFIVLGRLPAIAAAFERGDAATQAALAAVWRTTLDPFGLWGYGAIGLWILTVALTMARQTDSHFPAALGYLGIVAAVVHWLVPIAFLARMPFLFYVVAAAG